MSVTKTFYESLVGNVPLEPPRLLTSFEGEAPAKIRMPGAATGSSLSMPAQTGPCPFPDIEGHILATWQQVCNTCQP